MFCTQCGKENSDNATVCANCSSPLPQASSEPVTQPEVQAPPAGYTAAPPPPISTASGAEIKNYLVQSILCCLPLGSAAIVFSASVNGKIQSGDLAGAQQASDKAKMFCWLSLGLGLVASILVVFLQIGAAAAAGSY